MYAWFSISDDWGKQSGYTVYCVDEEDAWDAFHKSCGNDWYADDYGFNEISLYEIMWEIMDDYHRFASAGLISEKLQVILENIWEDIGAEI